METKLFNAQNGQFDIGYYVFLPEDYSPEKKYPMVVFLHGAGERGNGKDELCKIQKHALPKYAAAGKKFPFILLCPQCPGRIVWNNIVFELKALIDKVAEEYNADMGRIAITGLSMGGFGAMRNGLKYNETFGQIISLSPALHMFDGPEPHIMGLLGKGKEAWEEVENSDLNPRWLIEHIRGEKPGVYLACGMQDELLPGSQVHRKLLKDAGFQVHYVEDEGNHDWDYWDRHIKLALDWLPLDERVGGLNSGNIKGE